MSGIVIGGTMSAVTLTGRRLADGLQRRRDEIEAWLALGASRVAVRDVARTAVFEGLVPALDQTRTVGLVTLPGSCVVTYADAHRLPVIGRAGTTVVHRTRQSLW